MGDGLRDAILAYTGFTVATPLVSASLIDDSDVADICTNLQYDPGAGNRHLNIGEKSMARLFFAEVRRIHQPACGIHSPL